MRIRVRWNAPRTSTAVVTSALASPSPWTVNSRKLTGNPAAIESQNGQYSDVVLAQRAILREDQGCGCNVRRAREQKARHAERTARNGGELAAMLALSLSLLALEMRKFEGICVCYACGSKKSSSFSHFKAQDLSSVSALGLLSGPPWRRSRHRCARYAQHVLPPDRVPRTSPRMQP